MTAPPYSTMDLPTKKTNCGSNLVNLPNRSMATLFSASTKSVASATWFDLPNELRSKILRHVFAGMHLTIGAKKPSKTAEKNSSNAWPPQKPYEIPTRNFTKTNLDRPLQVQISSILLVSRKFTRSAEVRKAMLKGVTLILGPNASSLLRRATLHDDPPERLLIRTVYPSPFYTTLRADRPIPNDPSQLIHQLDWTIQEFPRLSKIHMDIMTATSGVMTIFMTHPQGDHLTQFPTVHVEATLTRNARSAVFDNFAARCTTRAGPAFMDTVRLLLERAKTRDIELIFHLVCDITTGLRCCRLPCVSSSLIGC